MAKFEVELVSYDMDKTKKRKRANFFVDSQTEEAVIEKLEKIHKGEKVQKIHGIFWSLGNEEVKPKAPIFIGTIKFFDREKGFGFIEPESDRDDLFFHVSALGEQEVMDGDDVEFEIGKGPKGDVAIHIKLMDY